MSKELRNNTFHILLSYFKRGILARVYFLMAWTGQCACAVGVGHTSEYWGTWVQHSRAPPWHVVSYHYALKTNRFVYAYYLQSFCKPFT